MMKNVPGVARSSSRTSASRAPNATSAFHTLRAFSRLLPMKMSESFVARARPRNAKAYALISRYLAPAAFKAAKRSIKSIFRCIASPRHTQDEFPNGVDAFLRRQSRLLLAFVSGGFCRRVGDETAPSLPPLRRPISRIHCELIFASERAAPRKTPHSRSPRFTKPMTPHFATETPSV